MVQLNIDQQLAKSLVNQPDLKVAPVNKQKIRKK
jgi:hypothetical protein